MLAAWENLKSFKPTPGVGVLFFNNNDLCGIPDGPAVLVKELTTAHFNALKAEVDKQNAKGETPIIGALMRSYNYFHENAADFEGNRFVVLLTDGSETCDKDNKEFLLEKVELAAAIGIRTFVMGVPGSEGERSFLSQIAKLGETAPEDCSFSATDPTVGNCHMDMTDESLTFADELSKNLEKISLVALSCVIDVPEPKSGETVKPDMVNVIYWEGGVESDDIADGIVPQDYNTECSDPKNQGWQYAPGDQSKIVLCGELCEKVKNDNKAIVAVTLDCPTIVK
ncbi:MAG: VWA domain-containing protein [Polyangiaceae bacterium]|nr:VWA domain-containing protein [Polyangiaceae bacterium]